MKRQILRNKEIWNILENIKNTYKLVMRLRKKKVSKLPTS